MADSSLSASQESIDNLINLISGNVDLFTEGAEVSITFLNRIKSNFNNKNYHKFDKEIENLCRLLEYNILINLVLLDYSTLLKLYLNANKRYDQIYACKQIYVVINESYKKVYGYSEKIKQSFWVKDINPLVKLYASFMKEEYESLTRNVIDFVNANFINGELKYNRDLSVHYDMTPSKVYSMITNFNEDELLKKSSEYFSLLNKTVAFSTSLLIEFDKFLSQQVNTEFETHLQLFEKWQKKYQTNKNALDIILNGKQNLINLRNNYNLWQNGIKL